MEAKHVHEMMIPLEKFPHVHEWQTIKDAILEMEKCQLETQSGRLSVPRAVLVFGKHNELLGTVRRRDILRGIEPDFLVRKPLVERKRIFDIKVDPNLSELSYDHLEPAIIEQSKTPVSEIMRSLELTINHDDHIIKAMYEMVDNNISILPVMQGEKVVGVLRSVDLLHVIAQIVLTPEEMDQIGLCCDS